MSDHRALHTEILARLKDASGRELAAGDFMPIVAAHGLVQELDRGVIERVLEHARERDDMISINVSMHSAEAPLFAGGTLGALAFLCVGLAVMGFAYGPLGTFLGELFPTSVRYTGASLTFNLAGILGGSLAPYLATSLASRYGLTYVGYYVAVVGVVTLVALLLIKER